MAEPNDREGLSNLNDLRDYEVADGEPDPRGWDLFAGDGVKVGRIQDLLVDTGQMRVRAIECRIDEQSLNLPHGDSRLFIPIRSVSLDESAERAVVPGLRSDQIQDLRGRTDFSSFGARDLGTTDTGRETRRATLRESERQPLSARAAGAEIHEREVRFPAEDERGRTVSREHIVLRKRYIGTGEGEPETRRRGVDIRTGREPDRESGR